MRGSRSLRSLLLVPLAAGALLAGGIGAALGVCGPFTDVSDAGFCPFVLEIFTLGITTGTTPTTYDPAGNVTRLQMAAFLSRGVDSVLQRGSRRALVKKFWTPQNPQVLGRTSLSMSTNPAFVESDGKDLWVSGFTIGTVARVRASDGRLLETWTGADHPLGVLVAMGRVFAVGVSSPGRLYRIDPRQPAGAMTLVSSSLGTNSQILAFDGNRIWSSNAFNGVSIVTPAATIPWTATTITTGFVHPNSLVYDGSNIWVSDESGFLRRLDSDGAVLQNVTVGTSDGQLVFDGANIWAPDGPSNSIRIVRASSGAVLAALTGNGLNSPYTAAFDGQRVLVVNSGENSVSLWKAADLTPLGFFPTGTGTAPSGICSDGFNFWIALSATNELARF